MNATRVKKYLQLLLLLLLLLLLSLIATLLRFEFKKGEREKWRKWRQRHAWETADSKPTNWQALAGRVIKSNESKTFKIDGQAMRGGTPRKTISTM
jgi:hypothetical protein